MNASTPASTSSFDVLTGSDDDPLLAAAARATTAAIERDDVGVLVIVVRPNADDVKVVSGGGTGVLRAAVSVAVAAGNDRLWRTAPNGETAEYPVAALPEVITASAAAAGVHLAHTGCVRRDPDTTDEIDAVAIWFESWGGVADPDERRRVLADLERGAILAAERRAAEAERNASATPLEPEAAPTRTWSADDPTVDPLTGVLTAAAFVDHFDAFAGDDATMIMVDLDAFRAVTDAHGDDAADAILREIADRIVAELGPTDVVGRVGHDRFAILLGDVARTEVMVVAKRVLAAVSTPLPADLGPEAVTATAALAYQDGLVDLEELYDSAASAMASGKRAGSGGLVLAA